MGKEIASTVETPAPILWPIQDAFKRAQEFSLSAPAERYTGSWSFGRWDTQYLKIETPIDDYRVTNLTVCRILPEGNTVDVDYEDTMGVTKQVQEVGHFIFRCDEDLDFPQTIVAGDLGRTVMLLSSGRVHEREVVRPLEPVEVSDLGRQLLEGTIMKIEDENPIQLVSMQEL